MAKKKAAGKKAAGGKGDSYVVASKAKAFLQGKGCRVAGDALDGLNGVVGWYLEQAATRAKANGRGTVRPHDFIAM